MLNIVHFIHGLNMGGAETLVKEYALGLDKKKFNLTVVCLDNLHSPYDTLLKRHHIPVLYISDHISFYGKTSRWANIVHCLQYYYFVRKFLRQLNPNI